MKFRCALLKPINPFHVHKSEKALFVTTQPSSRRPILTIPTTRAGKVAFGIALVLWFMLLSLPCAMFWFASGNEISIPHGSVPDAYDHPLLELGLIMTAENRGLKIKTSSIMSRGDNAVCVQTSLNYILWYSQESNPSTTLCDCYGRISTDKSWSSTTSTAGQCQN